MRILSLVACAVIFASASVHAEDLIFFRIANGQEMISFTNISPITPEPMVREIAVRTIQKYFTPESVKSEYYQVNVVSNIVWQGAKISQYDYRPLANDRFRQVLWVEENTGMVIKLETYDMNESLMFSGIYLDAAPVSKVIKFSPFTEAADKSYYGFYNTRTETTVDGTLKLLFSDGLNRFSIFRAPNIKKTLAAPEQLVVYGNYVYNISREDYIYTVVGSIPFDKMEEVLAHFFPDSFEMPDSNVRAVFSGNEPQQGKH